jgi:hypothetical protein
MAALWRKLGIWSSIVAIHFFLIKIFLGNDASLHLRHHLPASDAVLILRFIPAAIEKKAQIVDFVDVSYEPPPNFLTVLPDEKVENSVSPEISFYSSKELDRRALPFSAPNPEVLKEISIVGGIGVTLRVRVYINAEGKIVKVLPLNPDDDLKLLSKVTEMMMQTAFTPAMRGGFYVASFQDLEFNISEVN